MSGEPWVCVIARICKVPTANGRRAYAIPIFFFCFSPPPHRDNPPSALCSANCRLCQAASPPVDPPRKACVGPTEPSMASRHIHCVHCSGRWETNVTWHGQALTINLRIDPEVGERGHTSFSGWAGCNEVFDINPMLWTRSSHWTLPNSSYSFHDANFGNCQQLLILNKIG